MRSTPKIYSDENFLLFEMGNLYTSTLQKTLCEMNIWNSYISTTWAPENFIFRAFSQGILLKHVIKIGFYDAFKASWQDLDDSSTDIHIRI